MNEKPTLTTDRPAVALRRACSPELDGLIAYMEAAAEWNERTAKEWAGTGSLESFLRQNAAAWRRAESKAIQCQENELTLPTAAMNSETQLQQPTGGRSAAVPGSAWVTPKEGTPEECEWVLHTYAGVRAPEYGMYARCRFWRNDGPESFPTTHWLRIPMIEPNAQSAGSAAQNSTDTQDAKS